VTYGNSDIKAKKGKKTGKCKKEDGKEKKKKEQKEKATNDGIKNENQCVNFKLKEEEQWSTFAGANLAD
jgi:hypothetical protein